MNKVFQLAEFFTPSYSVFPQPHEVKISHEIGNINVVDYYDLGPGDSIDIPIQQLSRFAPLAAPTMHNFKLDFHAFAVPYRLAMPMRTMSYMDGFESFFNLKISDDSRPLMPGVNTWNAWLSLLADYCSRHKLIGSLFDQCQYPIFIDLYRLICDQPNIVGGLSDVSIPTRGSYTWNDSKNFTIDYQSYDISFVGANSDHEYIIDEGVQIAPLCAFLYALASGADGRVGITQKINYLLFDTDDDSDPHYGWTLKAMISEVTGTPAGSADSKYIEDLLAACNLKLEEAIDRYISYIFAYSLEYLTFLIEDAGTTIDSPFINFLPIYAYWTVIWDWYINRNLQSTDDKATWLNTYLTLSTGQVKRVGWSLARRYWQDDYFTSAFQDSDIPAESVPGTGTIPALRAANSMQELKERILYAGPRYQDQILAIYGVHTNVSNFDRTQVIGSASFNMNISDVMQTSSDTELSSLGQMAGQGLSVGSKPFVRYTAQEHEIILITMSVRPTAIYEQQVPKLLFKSTPYDFLVPQLANVGEQVIDINEIYPSIIDAGGLNFGYTRRYAEYMHTPSHIAGEFRTSLDYWHAAREFDGPPVLNQNFCQIRPADGYNRIFAVPGASEHVYTFIYFDTVISRPLSRVVNYHL